MKSMLKIATASLALFGVSGLAHAQDQGVAVGGEVEASCTLPDTWAFVSQGGGASGSDFSGSTWAIPAAAFAGSNGVAVSGAEYAIRIRGTGFCNTSHTIRLQSSRGGLVTGDPTTPAPAGFTKRRPMKYDAYWSNGAGGSYGPAVSYTPTTPGQLSSVGTFTVSGSLAPPGNRGFDIRLGLARPVVAAPMLAGAYSDTVTVTIAVAN